MASYDLFLFTGHGDGDPGACSNGRQEHTEAKRLNAKILEYLAPTGLKIHTGVNNYQNNLLAGNTYTYNFGFTTHLNSAGAGATGIEVLCQGREKILNCEEAIINNIAKITGLSNRGLKSRCYNSEQWYKRTNGYSIGITDWFKELRDAKNRGICLSILEVCFISNTEDMQKFDKHFDDIAFTIASELAKACNTSITKPEAPITPNTPNGTLYKINTPILNVRAGAGTSYKITTTVKNGEVYTIMETKEANGYNWGRLKSGAGWIALNYCIKK